MKCTREAISGVAPQNSAWLGADVAASGKEMAREGRGGEAEGGRSTCRAEIDLSGAERSWARTETLPLGVTATAHPSPLNCAVRARLTRPPGCELSWPGRHGGDLLRRSAAVGPALSAERSLMSLQSRQLSTNFQAGGGARLFCSTGLVV